LSTFYICATPIGNLDDISKRLVDTLNSVDIVYAEDTRRGKKLLSHLDIKKPIYSYFVGNEKSKSNEILKQIKEGKSIALISDAGTPLISDPGEYLVKELIKNNVDIFAIPGPSSVLVALTLSGFDTGKFNFLGFVPKSGKDREKFYHQIKNSEATCGFCCCTLLLTNSRFD
jgi:16S rRNA (cytidine1402-2'-O)-methyltransferase